MVTVAVRDETTSGGTENALTLEFLDERVSARELIRARVFQEVSEFNARKQRFFRGLVQPRDAEQTREGFRLRRPRPIDWEEQFARALTAFQTNGFILIVDDRQVEDLDQMIDLRHDSSVSFLKLTPLVGG
jgi:hypothetical protein